MTRRISFCTYDLIRSGGLPDGGRKERAKRTTALSITRLRRIINYRVRLIGVSGTRQSSSSSSPYFPGYLRSTTLVLINLDPISHSICGQTHHSSLHITRSIAFNHFFFGVPRLPPTLGRRQSIRLLCTKREIYQRAINTRP